MGEVAAADPAAVVGAISDNRTWHGIPHTVSCRALGVSESRCCRWRDRPPTGREQRRQRLADETKEIFSESGGRATWRRSSPRRASYLATVIDLFSRRLLGYAMGAHHDADWSWPR